jgi:hypothetical protein
VDFTPNRAIVGTPDDCIREMKRIKALIDPDYVLMTPTGCRTWSSIGGSCGSSPRKSRRSSGPRPVLAWRARLEPADLRAPTSAHCGQLRVQGRPTLTPPGHFANKVTNPEGAEQFSAWAADGSAGVASRANSRPSTPAAEMAAFSIHPGRERGSARNAGEEERGR